MSGMVIKGLKITDDEIRYIFPRNIDKIISFKYLLPMRTLLKEQFMQLGLPNFPYYQTKRHAKKQNYKIGPVKRRRFRDPAWKPVQRQQVEKIDIFCRYCPNTLSFQFNQRQRCFKLKHFSVVHVHGRDKNQHQILKQNTNLTVYEWSKKQHENIQNRVDELVNRLEEPVGPTLLDTQTQKEPRNFNEMVQLLRSKNYFVYYEPQNFIENAQFFPDIFMFISPSMKQTYLKYHYCVGFDYTFSLIKEIPLKENQKQYLVGTISGLNQFRRLSIFALVISHGETVPSTMTVFTQFFKHMGDQPRSIVTDQSPGIIWGLRKLQQNGVMKGEALWDTFHTLKNYKMANPPLKQKMRMMIREKCKYSFQKMYLQAVEMARTEAELDSLHRFMYQSQKYCISQIKPVLVGMGVSNSQNQFVNSLIKDIITHQKHYVQVIYELSQFIEDRNNMNHVIRMPNINIQEGINRKDLKLLRLSLNIRYLSFFFTQYFRLINVNLIHFQQDRSVYYVHDRMNTHRVIKNELYDPIHNENISVEHQDIQYRYKCSCEFRQKTGIPCQHILKITTKHKDNILEQIHPKYVIKDPSDLIKCIKSSNKSDFNVPINKRGTWSSGRMLETYYVDRNSLQSQAQRKSADPRLIQPIPKGYLPALQQRNKIRNIRTQHQQSRKKFRENSLRTLSFHRFAHEGDFPEPQNTFEVKENDYQRKRKKDSMSDSFNQSFESQSMMESKGFEDEPSQYSQFASSSSGFIDTQQNQLISQENSRFSEFSEVDSEFSRNSLKNGKMKKRMNKYKKHHQFDSDFGDEQELTYLQNKGLYQNPMKNEKLYAQIKINQDQLDQEKEWGDQEIDQMYEKLNYIEIPDESECNEQKQGQNPEDYDLIEYQGNWPQNNENNNFKQKMGRYQISQKRAKDRFSTVKKSQKGFQKSSKRMNEYMENESSDFSNYMMDLGFYDDSFAEKGHHKHQPKKKKDFYIKNQGSEDENQFYSQSMEQSRNRNSQEDFSDDFSQDYDAHIEDNTTKKNNMI